MPNKQYPFRIGEVIKSHSTDYKLQKYLGQGIFGVVTQCRNLRTNEVVAVKMMSHKACFMNERKTLRSLRELQADRFNIVRWNNSFVYNGHFCHEFELLDMELFEFMQMSPAKHLHLKQIRPILQQLAVSLEFLRRAGFVHSDLKPQNIMMVDRVKQPLKVKIIDFGLAFNNPQRRIGQTLQTLWYRSPEILAKQPFKQAIDVWSLGCIAAELYMGKPLFPASTEEDMIKQIVYTVGKPRHEGDHAHYCFWPKQWMEQRKPEIYFLPGVEDYAEQWDLAWFIDLLVRMLMIRQGERITPTEILRHSFITLRLLQDNFKNSHYLAFSKEMMRVCHYPEILRMSRNKEFGSEEDEGVGGPAGTEEKEEEERSLSGVSTTTFGRKRITECDNRDNKPEAKRLRDQPSETGPRTRGQAKTRMNLRRRKKYDI